MCVKNKLEELIGIGEIVLIEERKTPHPGVIMADYLTGERYFDWLNRIHLLVVREMGEHPFSERMVEICKAKNGKIREAEELLGFLRSLLNDEAFLSEDKWQGEEQKSEDIINKKVFIVHGHDDAAINSVARALERDNFEPIILREQPDNGKTIIEKIEENANVVYAVVLYTPCDEGRDCVNGEGSLKKRARQNVVFEHGYLIGRLGRERVSALVRGDIETPGDISGVVYIPMDEQGGWKLKLVKNMKAAGLPVDANNWA